MYNYDLEPNPIMTFVGVFGSIVSLIMMFTESNEFGILFGILAVTFAFAARMNYELDEQIRRINNDIGKN